MTAPTKSDDGRLRENRIANGVVRDKSNKIDETFAVVRSGNLLPVRFASFDEAWDHLQKLEAA